MVNFTTVDGFPSDIQERVDLANRGAGPALYPSGEPWIEGLVCGLLGCSGCHTYHGGLSAEMGLTAYLGLVHGGLQLEGHKALLAAGLEVEPELV